VTTTRLLRQKVVLSGQLLLIYVSPLVLITAASQRFQALKCLPDMRRPAPGEGGSTSFKLAPP